MGNSPCFARKNKGIELRNETNKDQRLALNARTSDKSSAKMNVKLEPRLDLSVPKDNDHHKSNDLVFSYHELATATNNFSKKSFVGEGGFGAVYKGKLETTGQIVAVKQLNHNGLQGDKEFLVELLMLSLLRHPNLVNMIGYCAEGEQRLLVYEFMHWGSLEDHLHDLTCDMQPLCWNTRMMIAADAANGVNFLHNKANPQVIYRDLKSSNILLDERFHAKISDFGLAKFGPDDDKSHVSTRVMGTQGYCAPEYACSGQLTVKSDVYSFGVVLLELITGRRALDSRGNLLVAWARPMWGDPKNFVTLADPKLKGQFSKSILEKAMIVAIACLREDPHLRPSMNDVLKAMNYLVKVKESRLLNRNQDRERAVMEAKKWGETSRMKGQQHKQKGTDYLNP